MRRRTFSRSRDARLVTLVLPAKNEAAAIGRTLRSLPRSTLRAMGFESHVVVLDGCSTDATPQTARRWGATVVVDREPGKGAALRNALPVLRGEFVLMLDADGTYAADAIPLVLARLAWDGADVVMGVRAPQPGAMKGVHVIGNAMLSLTASVLYRRIVPDVCTGLWGFRTASLRTLPLRSRGFGLEAELFALASRLGHRITYVPVDYLPRDGKANLHFGRDGLRIVRRLMRSRFAELPNASNQDVGACPPEDPTGPAGARPGPAPAEAQA